ncbi:MAG: [FeFe] hydrogenase H-cluster radical SAM maturase HydG [Halanaerobiales bacterium]
MSEDFIDDGKIKRQLKKARDFDPAEIRSILQKAYEKNRLNPMETAKLLQVEDQELLEEMYETAGKIKEDVYGKRIVLFAPLYVGNKCVNNCVYCGFRRDNDAVKRKTLSKKELEKEVEILESRGHKRLIMVYGSHPDYDADFMCETIENAYNTHHGQTGEIRRTNVNAAPQTVEDYKKLHEIGIGTFQIFQETYHHETYKKVHPPGDIKNDYQWRLYGLDRAMEAGIDDVGIGALFGLYEDWKFEVMGLLYHSIHLEEKFGVGPHTISFPRMEPALNTPFYDQINHVSDKDFKKIVAVLRLSVPYTGLILTARENPDVREEVMPVGVTQIDAGSRIGIGGYKESENENIPEKEQFQLGDLRPLDTVMKEICEMGWIPSFCTAGYRCGRTGEHFMSLAKPGDVHRFCMPNAVLTFKEYLLDYASPETKKVGEKTIEYILDEIEKKDKKRRKLVEEKIELIESGQRDVYV